MVNTSLSVQFFKVIFVIFLLLFFRYYLKVLKVGKL